MNCREMDREGNFRGKIIDYALYEAKDTQSVCVSLSVEVHEYWNGEEWEDWKEYQFLARGSIWIVGKEGDLKERAIDSLALYAGWNGDLNVINEGTWQPNPVQIKVAFDDYNYQKNGKQEYRIAYINGYDSKPGGSTMTKDRISDLSNRFGSQIRAIVGNAKMNSTPPATQTEPPTSSVPF